MSKLLALHLFQSQVSGVTLRGPTRGRDFREGSEREGEEGEVMDNSIIETLRAKGYELDGNSGQGPLGMHYGIQSDEVSTWVPHDERGIADNQRSNLFYRQKPLRQH
jgi:hypothetical protein